MGNTWFQFQQFRIIQDRCAMKISTDAVLLGALANAKSPGKILDIGTGTGVIALMLAQRFPQANVSAIEMDEDAAIQAGENFKESKFSERLELIHARLQEFSDVEKYDLIVSNPPFFPDHLKSQDSKRNKALHTDELSFEDLIEKVKTLLSDEGSFWVILPPRQMVLLDDLAKNSGLFLSKKIKVKDAQIKPVHREVCEFTFSNVVENEEELILKNSDSSFSGFYSNLISGFLLGY